MQINPKSMMFSDYTPEERKEMIRLARKIALGGVVEWNHPIISSWMEACCETESQKLLVASTVLPLRLLLSVVEL